MYEFGREIWMDSLCDYMKAAVFENKAHTPPE